MEQMEHQSQMEIKLGTNKKQICNLYSLSVAVVISFFLQCAF